jgi:hypothetical protein
MAKNKLGHFGNLESRVMEMQISLKVQILSIYKPNLTLTNLT